MKKHIFLSILLSFALLLASFPPIYAAEPESQTGKSTSQQTGDGSEQTDQPQEDEDPDAQQSDGEPTDEPESNGTFSVAAKAALLVELNSGSVVYEHNANERVYPASLTKIMTCLVALELCQDLSEDVTVTQTALEGLDPDGVTVSLQPGEVIPMRELLYCMMIPSANDACTVVAEHLCGTVDAFVQKMNEKAAQLGCTGTHFANPDGLHDDEHYTTVNDLRTMTEAALENEFFRELTSTTVHDVPATNLSQSRRIYTTNYLLSSDVNPDYYYEKAVGIKTGYTSQAGRCLISMAEQGNFRYLSIVVGCETKLNDDGSVVYESFVQAKKMLEYGLNNFAFVTVLSKLVPAAQVPVKGASVDSVVVVPANDVSALLPLDYSEENISVNYELIGDGTLTAPLAEDDNVGAIHVYYAGRQVGETTLRPLTSVERHEINYITRTAGNQLKKYVWLIIIAVIVILVLLLYLRSSRSRAKRKKKTPPGWDKE